MSELRDKIAEKLWADYDSEYAGSTKADFMEQATTILSLIDSSPVEGLEVFRKCEECAGNKFVFKRDMNISSHLTCSACHGTGEIVRPLTRGEALEAFAMLMDGRAAFNNITTVVILPDGSRIRVKK